MARRMFSDKIVDTDAFLDMGIGSQLLYFHLCMRADDDGFVANPKKIMRMIGSQEDDYKVLLGKRFIIQFESGVCVIKHWLIHNLIRFDRYNETQWVKEKSQLTIDPETKKYSLIKPNNDVIPNGNQLATQDRLGKDRLGKDIHTPKIAFSGFWSLYPKKVERKKSEAKWDKLDLATQEIIIADLRKRVLGEKWSKDGGKYIEMPTTYLNGERWNDEIIENKVAENKTHRV